MMRKNDAFVAKIVITYLTKKFIAIFGFCHPAESLTQFQHSPHSVKLDMMMMIKICIVYHTCIFSWGFSCRGGPLILLNGPSLLKMQIAIYFANGVEVQASMQARTQASTWESKQAKYRGYRIASTLLAQGGHNVPAPCRIFAYTKANTRTVHWKTWFFPFTSLDKGSILFSL